MLKDSEVLYYILFLYLQLSFTYNFFELSRHMFAVASLKIQ